MMQVTQVQKSGIQLENLQNMPIALNEQYQQNPFSNNYQYQQQQVQQQVDTDDMTLRAFNITGQLPNKQMYRQQIMEDNMKYQKTNSPMKILKPKNIKIEQTPTQESIRDTDLASFFVQQSNYQPDYQNNQLIRTNAYKLSPNQSQTVTIDKFDQQIQFNAYNQVAQGAVDDNNVERAQKSVRFADDNEEIINQYPQQRSNLISNTVVQHVPKQNQNQVQDENPQYQLSPQLQIPTHTIIPIDDKEQKKKLALIVLGVSLIIGLFILTILTQIDIQKAQIHWGQISIIGLKLFRIFLPKQYVQQSSHFTIQQPQKCPLNALCDENMSFITCEDGYYQYQSPLQSGSDLYFKLHNKFVSIRKTIDNLLNYRFEKETIQYYKINSCTTDIYKQKYFDRIFIKETRKLLQKQAKQFCKSKKQSDVMDDMRVTDLDILEELNKETKEYLEFIPEYIKLQTANPLIQEQINQFGEQQEYTKYPPVYISTTLDYMNYLPRFCKFSYYVRNNKLQFIGQTFKWLFTLILLVCVNMYFIIQHQSKQSYTLIKQYLIDDSYKHENEHNFGRENKYGIKESVLIQQFVSKNIFYILIRKQVIQKLQHSKDIGRSFSKNRNGIVENVYYYKGLDTGIVRISKSSSSELSENSEVLIEY